MTPARADYRERRLADPRWRTAYVTLVAGPPGAGKTTWVQERAKPGDLIVDLDAIYEALAGRPTERPRIGRELERFAWDARDAVLARLEAPRRTDPPLERAWIIHTAPTRRQRDEYRLRFNARVVVLAPSLDELERRLADRPAGHLRLAREWWEAYEPEPEDAP